jgi:hypothetical protein
MGNIAFELKSHEVELGETIEGSFICQGSKKSIAVEVSVGWHTSGKGDQDKVLVSKKIFNEIKSDVITPFALYLPTTAPPTYKGRLIRIDWEVKFTTCIQGFLGQGFLGKFGNQTEEYFAVLRVLPMKY